MELFCGNAFDAYPRWPSPVCIVSDGAYGIDGFEGDCSDPEGLSDWYESHIQAWSTAATALTTLWFWNTEVGWATVHPLLAKYGWVYRGCNVWDKGIGHIAGNCNTQTMRKFPVVTEVCAHYVRKTEFRLNGSLYSAQEWLRSEWARTGLPFSVANEACGVKNAATRKYLTSDHLWYFPPADVFERLVTYANERGDPTGRPYFALDGRAVVTATQWDKLRAIFKCPVGVTNVWRENAVRGRNRMQIEGRNFHPNEKPLKLISRIVECSTNEGDAVWEPFGGTFPVARICNRLRRESFSAEIDEDIYSISKSNYERFVAQNQDIFEA